MSTFELNDAAEQLQDLEEDYRAAKPFFDKHMVPWLDGAKATSAGMVMSGSLSHQDRDIQTGYSSACELFKRALETLYLIRKKELEETLKREQAKLDAKDRAQAKAAGQSDRDSDPDPFTG